MASIIVWAEAWTRQRHLRTLERYVHRLLALIAVLSITLLACANDAQTAPTPTSTASLMTPKATTSPPTSAPRPSGIPATASPAASPTAAVAAATPKDATYLVDGRAITLKDGNSDIEAAPGSASRIVTRYFGNEAKGDLNGDGLEDVGLLITHSPGGSGTFFYVVAALRTASGYVGT
ncbi:MAG TPA: hypothetical protein VMY34_10605, partial [Acidimicrobiales bacterium]|nr:hypothetical protein [Acidimicrobiales bacterium]